MNVFELRRRLIDDYSAYVKSFISIRDPRLREHVDRDLDDGLLWPEARIGLNPAFADGGWIDGLVEEGLLHPECGKVFRLKAGPHDAGRGLRLHRHQADAIRAARTGANYVLTTGTGSGKSLSYIIPIVDHVLRGDRKPGIKAIVVYPMNALANSQAQELEKFLCFGYPDGKGPVTFHRYTGQESDEDKQRIIAAPPDILLTNYVMLELILTRRDEKKLVEACRNLRFLVFDELHTYRGRQGADVALLARRTREASGSPQLQMVGTSATMGTVGGLDQQRAEVARVASLIFGATVEPANVIGETLRRATAEPNLDDPAFLDALAERVGDPALPPPDTFAEFVADPLSRWVESAFGVVSEPESGRLVRARPRVIGGSGGAAHELGEQLGLDEVQCVARIQEQLLAGAKVLNPDTGLPVFAFRLHQFISRGDTVWATVEPEDRRYLTVYAQQFVPGDRERLLFPLVFCRACGQDYYAVRLHQDGPDPSIESRQPSEITADSGKNGYLYVSTAAPWPPDALQQGLFPEDWLEPDGLRLKGSMKHLQPRAIAVQPDGRLGAHGVQAHFVPAPFRLCLACGISYRGTQRSDFSKVGTLGSEGRSTATTILGLSAIRNLRQDTTLPEDARKLLSFTDNRQDASLQAGHFNDFIQVGLLRSGLYRAVEKAGAQGIAHDVLTQKVFESLALPFELYASDPGVKFLARQETDKALRDVLGYRLYLDQRRGWRITSPNLEQVGLLRIDYASLSELCAANEEWDGRHLALATASPATREAVARVLLDLLRRELAIKVDYLDQTFQERLQQLSSQRLREPWALDDQELLEHAAIALPRPRRERDYGGWFFLSARGGFGQYIRRPGTFPVMQSLDLAATQDVIRDLLEVLCVAGLVQRVLEPERGEPDQVPGYQLVAAAMTWVVDEGKEVVHDPIQVPKPPKERPRPNRFFVEFYKTIAVQGQGLEAREHTAQVPYDQREDRERRFRTAELPLLFCSPTMELGVDIARLNVVNLRNVPPTPANYAQRSGRAGRGGQPALVFTYCSTGSPHDQYFFRRPELMVSGQVAPPRLDLMNEDLVRAHLHAVWLAETGMSLGGSLGDIVDLSGEKPTLALQSSVRVDVDAPQPRQRAVVRSRRVLADLVADLKATGWWSDRWLDDAMTTVGVEFEAATDRWRGLYRAALAQSNSQHRVIQDASRSEKDRREARKLRAEAEAQLTLLRNAATGGSQSDFYSYRYFASEGFLPGYSFPRLPLSAFIPGRRGSRGHDDFLSRPRFLAISEFGPRNFVYHEGSRYLIHRVILPVAEVSQATQEQGPITSSAKRCRECGYLHPLGGNKGADLCESCGSELPPPLTQLFRLQNVVTRRRDRISSDEEERQRQGYDLQSSIRFAEVDSQPVRQMATVQGPEGPLATLTYGHAATIRRINLGWRRRKPESHPGFVLDLERGYWSSEGSLEENDQDPMSPRLDRVVPFVEDRKNALLLQPAADLDERVMASLQAALKSAIQVVYQLEDGELAAEPLPGLARRRFILFYEAAEGGAGVLRRLVDDPGALAQVAREALAICHYDPDTGADRGHAPGARERCEAACYDCLMSYTNQPEHKLLDRSQLLEILRALAQASVACSPAPESRVAHHQRLRALTQSDLERRWLDLLMDGGHKLPTDAQKLLADAGTRPDFAYLGDHVAVYVDGPVHDYPERAARDGQQQAALESLGWIVVRFRHDDEWKARLAELPSVFGEGRQS